MTLQMLNCFFAVAQTLSFSRAAEMLFISQPAVSKSVTMLEDELKISLLNRDVRRSIQLTKAGEILLECLKDCRKTWDAGLLKIRELSGSTSLIINLPKNTTLPFDKLQIIDQFHQHHPDVEVFVHFIDLRHIAEHMSQGELLILPDLMLNTLGKCNTVKITSSPVPCYIVCSSEHQALHTKSSLEITDLAGSPLFLPEDLPLSFSSVLQKIADSSTGDCDQLLRLNSMETVMLLLHTGVGITVLDGWSASLNNNKLHYFQTEHSVNYMICWSSASQNRNSATLAEALSAVHNR